MIRLASGVVRPRKPTATTATTVATNAVIERREHGGDDERHGLPSERQQPAEHREHALAKFTIPVALQTRTSDMPTIAKTEPVEIPNDDELEERRHAWFSEGPPR